MEQESLREVVLEPLPKSLVIEGIELNTEIHWTINFEYIYNRLISGLAHSQYVIGLTNNGKDLETTAIKIGDRYYSPLVKQNTSFLVFHTIDPDPLIEFYDENYRPYCLADFDN